MNIDIDKLSAEERIALAVKTLYRNYGYAEYKLSGFEDYSLYANNGNFPNNREVLTFGTGEKLYALRPDVTLGIIKNAHAFAAGDTEKLFYDEKVYRKTNGEFRDLRQLGVEVIGNVDAVTEEEVCELALETLSAAGLPYALDVAHAGVIEKTVGGMDLYGADRLFVLKCLQSKNVHDFRAFGVGAGLDKTYSDAFAELISLPSESVEALSGLRCIAARVPELCPEVKELEELHRAFPNVYIDFSIGGDYDYYNGIVFKGYVNGVPNGVLSGGRYDKLLHRFGGRGNAIGFALYLGELECLSPASPPPDALVLYDERSMRSAKALADRLRKSGLCVLLSRTVMPAAKVYKAEADND